MNNAESPLAAMFDDLRREWDKTEHFMKIAENAVGEPIGPSVFELRYAGRRFIDAYSKQNVEHDDEAASHFLHDAIFNCHRARHDAVDSATAVMSNDLAASVQSLGYDPVLAAFGHYAELDKKLRAIRAKIAVSRNDRENRDLIYDTLVMADGLFTEVVELYDDFKSSEQIMKDTAVQQRRRRLGSYSIGIVGVISGLLCFML